MILSSWWLFSSYRDVLNRCLLEGPNDLTIPFFLPSFSIISIHEHSHLIILMHRLCGNLHAVKDCYCIQQISKGLNNFYVESLHSIPYQCGNWIIFHEHLYKCEYCMEVVYYIIINIFKLVIKKLTGTAMLNEMDIYNLLPKPLSTISSHIHVCYTKSYNINKIYIPSNLWYKLHLSRW